MINERRLYEPPVPLYLLAFPIASTVRVSVDGKPVPFDMAADELIPEAASGSMLEIEYEPEVGS